MSHRAISMALTAVPQGLKAPMRRILSVTRWTSVGSSPRNHRLEIVLDGFSLTVARNTLVGNYSNYRVLPDDGTHKVGDLDGDMPRPLFRERHAAALSSRQRRCGCGRRKRS